MCSRSTRTLDMVLLQRAKTKYLPGCSKPGIDCLPVFISRLSEGDGLQRVALEWLYLAMLYRTQHPVQRNGGYAMLSCKLQLLDAGIIRSANENGRCRFKIFVVSTTCNMLASTLYDVTSQLPICFTTLDKWSKSKSLKPVEETTIFCKPISNE